MGHVTEPHDPFLVQVRIQEQAQRQLGNPIIKHGLSQ